MYFTWLADNSPPKLFLLLLFLYVSSALPLLSFMHLRTVSIYGVYVYL
jgi:hypothetical protein